MRRDHKNKILILFLIIAALTILLSTMFGEPRKVDGETGGGFLRNFVFDFQTLFTGILAVGAATWTVLTMDRTDARSEKRHRELVAISMRGEFRALERAMNPQREELELVLQRISNGDTKFDAQMTSWDWMRRASAEYFYDILQMRDILKRPQIVEGAIYFDGTLSSTYIDCLHLLEKIENDMRSHRRAMDWVDEGNHSDFSQYFYWWEEDGEEIVARARGLFQKITPLIANLHRVDEETKRLQKKYRID